MNLVLEWSNQVASLLRFVTHTTTTTMTYDDTNMAEQLDQPIDLVEEDEEEWPEAGAQNPGEAQQYIDKVNLIFDHLSTLIHEDVKDALGQMVKNLKKVVAKQWESMGDADVDIILRTIRDPTALYLRQHLTSGGIVMVDPPEEIPTGQEFLQKLPERTRQAEELAYIGDIFDQRGTGTWAPFRGMRQHRCIGLR